MHGGRLKTFCIEHSCFMPRKNRGNRRIRHHKHRPQKKLNKQQQTYKRVIKLLQIFDKWTKQNDRKNIYSLICDYYNSSNIDSFLDDYDYIVNNIDIHKQYLNHHNKCNANNCLYLKRNYRNTSELSKENTKRT
eukprot:480307_1